MTTKQPPAQKHLEKIRKLFEDCYTKNYFHDGNVPSEHLGSPFEKTSLGHYRWPHTAAAFRVYTSGLQEGQKLTHESAPTSEGLTFDEWFNSQYGKDWADEKLPQYQQLKECWQASRNIKLPDEHAILNAQFKVNDKGSVDFLYGATWVISEIQRLNRAGEP